MSAYASLADLEDRHPQELILLAADEVTGVRDDARIALALADASVEIRAILQARYTPAELGTLDDESLAILRLYAMDIALHRIALAFSRQSDAIRERRDAAIKRLEAIAAGRGALTFLSATGPAGTPGAPSPTGEPASPNAVLVSAPERLMTRDRLEGAFG